VDRVAARIGFEHETITLDHAPLATPAALFSKFREVWLGRGKSSAAIEAAAHVLSTLPPGEGISAADLARAAARLGAAADGKELDTILREGVAAGLLAEGGGSATPLFRSRGEPDPEDGATLALEDAPGGALADPRASDLTGLLALARLASAEPRAGRILFAPDPVRLGRAVTDLATIPAVERAVAVSASFRAAVSKVRSRAGRTLLHTGLAVLRVDDPMLALGLSRKFPNAMRPLGGPWYAALTEALPKIVAAAGQEGFGTRRFA
jgi:hypothetical protein